MISRLRAISTVAVQSSQPELRQHVLQVLVHYLNLAQRPQTLSSRALLLRQLRVLLAAPDQELQVAHQLVLAAIPPTLTSPGSESTAPPRSGPCPAPGSRCACSSSPSGCCGPVAAAARTACRSATGSADAPYYEPIVAIPYIRIL